MNRRELLRAIVASPLALAATRQGSSQTYVYVTVARATYEGWLPAKVWLDGVDVANDCRAFDDREGYVVLIIKRDSSGKHFIDPETRRVSTEIKRGRVRFEPYTLRPESCQPREGE